MLHYYPRHVSSINMPIFRRTNCIQTASGIVALELSELTQFQSDDIQHSDRHSCSVVEWRPAALNERTTAQPTCLRFVESFCTGFWTSRSVAANRDVDRVTETLGDGNVCSQVYGKLSVNRNLQGQVLKTIRKLSENETPQHFNLLKPTGYVMHRQFNIQQLYALPTLYLCILYLSENKQRLVPLTV